MSPQISVVLPTHNRADTLERTLRGFERLDRTDIDVKFVIVDNASPDRTKAVIEDFASRVPCQYLYEGEPGKNRALNRALDDGDLGEIVLFTDDDIDADEQWLQCVWACTQRWPEHSFFGGKIQVVWPIENVPEWAHIPAIMEFGFASHDYAPEEREYDGRALPFGPSFWVRGEALEGGPRFLENIGPHPTNMTLGDETLFMMELREQCGVPVYCPSAVVGHRIRAEVVDEEGIKRRAVQLGRGFPHVYGVHRAELHEKNPLLWRILCWGDLVKEYVGLTVARVYPTTTRMDKTVHRLRKIGTQLESLRLAGDTRD